MSLFAPNKINVHRKIIAKKSRFVCRKIAFCCLIAQYIGKLNITYIFNYLYIRYYILKDWQQSPWQKRLQWQCYFAASSNICIKCALIKFEFWSLLLSQYLVTFCENEVGILTCSWALPVALCQLDCPCLLSSGERRHSAGRHLLGRGRKFWGAFRHLSQVHLNTLMN